MKHCQRTCRWAALLLAAAFLFACASARDSTVDAKKSGNFPCVAADRLEQEIAPEASLEGLSCSMKPWAGAETLHIQVAVKNVSDTPQRYRVNIFLDNGKAVGGLIPRKTKNGLVEPGAAASFVYPVQGMPRRPGSMLLKITTVSP